jgi:arylsulfatase A-like enzyme
MIDNYENTGLVSGLDWMVGQLVDMVTTKGMLDNTYIIFQSDVR